MVQRGYMTEEFFQCFINNLTEYQFNLAIENMFKVQNTEMAEHLVRNHAGRIREPLYQLVFKILQENPDPQDDKPCQ